MGFSSSLSSVPQSDCLPLTGLSSLTPEALAEEFGPKGSVAGQMVAALYERLLDSLTKPDNPYPKAAILFSEWDRVFGIVYGQDILKGPPGDLDRRARRWLQFPTGLVFCRPTNY